MASLKERLQARTDVSQQTVVLQSAGGEEAVIRRLTVAERNQLVDRFKIGTTDQKPSDESGMTYAIAIIALSLVPQETEEDVLTYPAAVADELAEKIMEFNGWTERSRKELADQFRPTTGPTV